ncbi:MAG TPA: hypothetical protein PLK88_05375 [Methanothrix sp.]|nr:hypothetical protein [Methanothrix sp.]HQJ79959.1 hypothetical protein [Methanothrix sp.]
MSRGITLDLTLAEFSKLLSHNKDHATNADDLVQIRPTLIKGHGKQITEVYHVLSD